MSPEMVRGPADPLERGEAKLRIRSDGQHTHIYAVVIGITGAEEEHEFRWAQAVTFAADPKSMPTARIEVDGAEFDATGPVVEVPGARRPADREIVDRVIAEILDRLDGRMAKLRRDSADAGDRHDAEGCDDIDREYAEIESIRCALERPSAEGCRCREIQREDPRRHFQGCPRLEPLPDPARVTTLTILTDEERADLERGRALREARGATIHAPASTWAVVEERFAFRLAEALGLYPTEGDPKSHASIDALLVLVRERCTPRSSAAP